MMMLLERGNKRWEGWSWVLLVSIMKKNALHADYRKTGNYKKENMRIKESLYAIYLKINTINLLVHFL